MNKRAVLFVLGCVGMILAGFLLVPALVSLVYGDEHEARAFVLSALMAALPSGLLAWSFRGSMVRSDGRLDFYRREGLAAVGLSWLIAALVGALPFVLTGLLDPVEAFFESTSGFTTTGATILTGADFDRLSEFKGLGFWRSFTHWIGGVGIVLVFVVLFPTGGRSLFRSEVPGISREASAHRVRDSAMTLIKIYVGLTVLQIGLLLLWLPDSAVGGAAMSFGDNLYEASLHAFGTLATGGFSNHPGSIRDFGSWQIELVILAFMFLAGINFAAYDLGMRKGLGAMWKALSRSTETRVYVGLILGCSLLIGLILWFWGGVEGDPDLEYSSLAHSLRDSSFIVVSLQTGTGYGTADFDQWPHFCRMLLMLLAFIGASAGSTCGGLKVVRFLILAKASWRGVRRFARPRTVHALHLGDDALDEGIVASVMGYCGVWALVFVGGSLTIIGLENLEPVSGIAAVLATLNNIGPGLGMVGPTENYAFFSDLGKLLLSLFMILGRLEFYALLVLLTPRFWRQ